MSDQLRSAELRRIFAVDVRPYLECSRNETERDRISLPRFVSVGGQPGAGKGRVLEEVSDALPGSVIVNGDELRQFHPDYGRLMRADPLRMPEVTASAAGAWVGMANDYLREQGISAVVETTLRQPSVLLREFELFRQAGYETELRVVAVPLEVSRLGTVTRYLEQVKDSGGGRWTPGAHHDVAAAAVPDTVAALVASGLVDRVVVQDRDGTVLLDVRVSEGGRESAQRAVAAVDDARDVGRMTSEQARLWVGRIQTALRDRVRLRQDDPDLAHVVSQLATTDAVAVVARAYPDDRATQRAMLAELAQASSPPSR